MTIIDNDDDDEQFEYNGLIGSHVYDINFPLKKMQKKLSELQPI